MLSPTLTSDAPSPLRVLVVEDDERSGRMLAGLLRRDGFVAELCPGGVAGLQRLAENSPPPDVLVTDLRMPQIDGITVARLARTHNPTLPILIITAYPDLTRRLDDADPIPQIFIKPLDYPAFITALRGLRKTA